MKKLCILLIFSLLKVKTLNGQILYAQSVCNIRKKSEHMQAILNSANG